MAETILSAVGFARARPDKIAELGRLLVSFAEWSRAEHGCVHSWIHHDISDPQQFVFYEMWNSEADLTRHLAQPYMQEFLATRLDYLEQDLVVTQLRPAGSAPEAPQTTEAVGLSDPAEMNQKYLDAYEARNVEAIMAVYAPGSVAVWEPGKAVSGNAHREAVVEFLTLDPHLTAEVLESYVAGDIAVLVTAWSIEVPGAPDMTGTGRGFDVLTKNANGEWRYVITNPFGSL